MMPRLALVISSNSYKDREKEIIKQTAIEEYVTMNWKDDQFVGDNPLLLWHDGAPIGKCVFADMEGPFLVEVFQELPDAEINLAAEGKAPMMARIKAVWDALEERDDLGASIGFAFRKSDREDGIYENIGKFETSILPREAAANIFTEVEIIRSVQHE